MADASRFIAVVRRAIDLAKELEAHAVMVATLTSAMLDEHARGAIVRENAVTLAQIRESAILDLAAVRPALKQLAAELPALLALIPPEGRA